MNEKGKSNRGGPRENSGRKQSFGEPTRPITIRVPISRIPEFRKHVAGLLEMWRVIDNVVKKVL
jgi:hypothetical protein